MSRAFAYLRASVVATLLAALALPWGPLNCLLCSQCGAATTPGFKAAQSFAAAPDGSCRAPSADGPACCCCDQPADPSSDSAAPSTIGQSCCGLPDSGHSRGDSCPCCAGPLPADRAPAAAAPSTTDHDLHLPAIVAEPLNYRVERPADLAARLAALAPPIPHRVLHCSWLK